MGDFRGGVRSAARSWAGELYFFADMLLYWVAQAMEEDLVLAVGR